MYRWIYRNYYGIQSRLLSGSISPKYVMLHVFLRRYYTFYVFNPLAQGGGGGRRRTVPPLPPVGRKKVKF